GWSQNHFFQASDEVDLVLAFRYLSGQLNFQSSSFKPTIQSVNQSIKRVYIKDSSYSIRDFFNSLPGSTANKSIVTGNVIVSNQGQLFYGGGTRVRSITTDNMDGVQTKVSYGYHHINSPTRSSGITVSEPKIYPEDKMKDIVSS